MKISGSTRKIFDCMKMSSYIKTAFDSMKLFIFLFKRTVLIVWKYLVLPPQKKNGLYEDIWFTKKEKILYDNYLVLKKLIV